jgi:hypothetical protein
MHCGKRMSLLLGSLMALSLWAGLSVLKAPVAHAVITCNKVAALNGSDSNSGTVSSPYRTPQHLVNSLAAGQTGCLRTGTFRGNAHPSDGHLEVQVPASKTGITLSSYPGDRARLQGALWVRADGMTVTDLDLDGTNSPATVSLSITADNVVLRGNDITSDDTAICILPSAYDGSPPTGTVIDRNRIHDCGDHAAHPGLDHGIYLESTRDTTITNNLIYDHAAFGVQFYPDADGTYAADNIIDGNRSGVTFSGEGANSSDDNTLENNVVSNSYGGGEGDTTGLGWNIQSYWGGDVGTGNLAQANCLYASNPNDPNVNWYNRNGGVYPDVEGVTVTGNTIAGPPFSDPPIYLGRENKNFHLDPSGPCSGIVDDAAASNARWSAPSAIETSTANQDSLLPDINMGSDGTAAAGWRRFNGTNWIVQGAVRSPGSKWGAVSDLSAAGQDAFDPATGVAADGTVVAVWRRFDGANWRIESRVKPSGGNWGSVSLLSTLGADALQPALAVSSNGTAVAAWRQFDGLNWRIRTSVRPPGGSWSSPSLLSVGLQNAEDPGIAVGSDGTAIAIWRRYTGSYWRVEANVRPPGGPWGFASILSTSTNAYQPRIDIGAGGRAVAVWRRHDGTNSRIEAIQRPPGGPWGSVSTLSAAGQNADGPDVGVAADGTAIASWRRSDGTGYVAQASILSPGGTWGAASSLSDSGVDPGGARVDVGDDGNAIVIWRRMDSALGVHRAEAAVRPSQGSWDSTSKLSTVGYAANNVRIALDGNGRAVAIWQEHRGFQRIYLSDYWL